MTEGAGSRRLLWVNGERTVMVEQWLTTEARLISYVSTRPDPGATWGPPVQCIADADTAAALINTQSTEG